MVFTKLYISIFYALFAFIACADVNDSLMGCFKYSSVIANYESYNVDTTDPVCINTCAANHYKYNKV